MTTNATWCARDAPLATGPVSHDSFALLPIHLALGFNDVKHATSTTNATSNSRHYAAPGPPLAKGTGDNNQAALQLVSALSLVIHHTARMFTTCSGWLSNTGAAFAAQRGCSCRPGRRPPAPTQTRRSTLRGCASGAGTPSRRHCAGCRRSGRQRQAQSLSDACTLVLPP
jgi:hypothetical protein